MQVKIKNIAVEMEVKNTGIEFEIRSPDGSKQIGDLVLTKSKLVWCPGKTSVANGVAVKWEQLQVLLASKEALDVALAAAKAV